MKRHVFLWTALLCVVQVASARLADSLTLSKCNATLALRLERYDRDRVAARLSALSDTLPVVVRCTDAALFVSMMDNRGIEATYITDDVATARIPVARIAEIAASDVVERIDASTPARPSMDKARPASGIDAIHAAEGLESPFTGKGVLVGIIDQGFEYTHPAFSDSEGNLRIHSIWNRFRNESKISDAAQIRKKIHDGSGATHATHVTGIAAGTHLPENSYGGVAPDAQLVLISSNLYDSEILDGVKYICEVAQQNSQPCVINMSFGSQSGPHDGTATYTLAIDRLLGAGRLNVVAMGNDGDERLHASRKIETSADTLLLPVDHRSATSGSVLFYIWSEAPCTELPGLEFMLYNTTDHTLTKLSASEQKRVNVVARKSATNGKYSAEVTYPTSIPYLSSDHLLCVALSGGDTGQTYHAWADNVEYGCFLTSDEAGTLTSGDHFYMNGNWADSRRSLAIGAWASRNRFTSLSDGRTYRFPAEAVEGDIHGFSNYGPVLGDFSPKPLVCAPGNIVSSISDYTADHVGNPRRCVSVVERGGEQYYYGIECGTSMASPMVAGAMACWLQAYPDLTPEQAEEIVSRTATNDAYTGEVRDKWDLHWGYGKFNAYDGLKECIRLAHAAGINAPLGEQPFTLSRETGRWRVLFNQPVGRAVLTLTAADGRCVWQRALRHVQAGSEETVDMLSLLPGVYVVHLEADGVKWTRKFVR